MTTSTEAETDPAYAAIEDLGAAPLWRYYGNLFPAEPRSAAVPYVWRYHALRPHLLHFAETLSLEEAERRVLMLINPGMSDPPATVNSLYAGIQVILPGETAQAHRHAANAFRFVIEGDGAYTTVDGERLHMRPGDLLLTPGWHWHDHYHEGDGPMIWLDALDYPLVNALEAGFFELFECRSQRPVVPDNISSRQFVHGHLVPAWDIARSEVSPIGNYPWAQTERAFDAIAEDAEGSQVDGIVLEYTNPWTGGPVMPTMSCRVQRLPPGFRGAAFRRTASSVLHVVRGSGTILIDDERYDWHDRDVIAVPGWAICELRNPSATEDAILFSFSNEPVLRALGLYREELTERQG
ncbi:cupin domain-containing protein [Amycolatopsis anabasis]|uniref:cupin domain-containing protein n=1 Tax=Amycolatopsis anabasis TaxID=1840409 RepID=UPI00131DBB6E|nr:cupin domain-containing protein [Amycolatopsis anabasis]